MATYARDICETALGLIGVADPVNSPDAEDLQSAFDHLNMLVHSLSINRRYIAELTQIPFTLTANKAAYTIGATATDFVTAEPIYVDDSSFIRWMNVDYPLNKITSEEYADISLKSVTSTWPEFINFVNTQPIGTIQLWPVPTVPATLYLRTQQLVATLTDVNSQIQMAPGFRRMLSYRLAIDIAPLFGVEPAPTVKMIAAQASKWFKRNSRAIQILEIPSQLVNPQGMNTYNIYNDS